MLHFKGYFFFFLPERIRNRGKVMTSLLKVFKRLKGKDFKNVHYHLSQTSKQVQMKNKSLKDLT